MGFYVDEFEVDLKQHINLSEHAWSVVADDMRNFYITAQASFSGFLNRVFGNFYQKADSNISLKYMEKSTELQALFSSKEFPPRESGITVIFEDKLLEQYETYLLEKANSYPKGNGKKFRINKSNLDILKDSLNSEYYNGSIGQYLKATFEEYCLKSPYERELIFFDDIVEKVEYAIAQKNKLKVTLVQKLANDGNLYSRQFYVSPYKIMHDKSGNFNYVVGYAQEINDREMEQEKRTVSLRLSRISKISVMKSMGASISKANQIALEREIQSKTPQFLAGDLSEVKIRFTKKGLESLERFIYMRPDTYEKISEDTYLFSCTEFQAFNYFFKFGKDAEVISPESLRSKLLNTYKEALEIYEKSK